MVILTCSKACVAQISLHNSPPPSSSLKSQNSSIRPPPHCLAPQCPVEVVFLKAMQAPGLATVDSENLSGVDRAGEDQDLPSLKSGVMVQTASCVHQFG